jgi:hypothetical protein
MPIEQTTRSDSVLQADRRATAYLIIGRLFRMASRPEQAGDAAEYLGLRDMLMDIGPATDMSGLAYMSAPSYAHDYRGSAA